MAEFYIDEVLVGGLEFEWGVLILYIHCMYTGYTCAFGINQTGVSYFIWTHFIVLIFELYMRSLLVISLKLIVML